LGLVRRVFTPGACTGRDLFSYVSLVRVSVCGCASVSVYASVYVCMCACFYGHYLVGPSVNAFILKIPRKDIA
jgi:hypothetical protein